ncbi:anti-repressor SinI family protein [Oceanobacillus sp. 1P07AA]
MDKTLHSVKVDQEWVRLIKQAKELGLTIEEIRQFIMITGHKV